jgi:hypothetical protein
MQYKKPPWLGRMRAENWWVLLIIVSQVFRFLEKYNLGDNLKKEEF